jgi:hypothetical protein
MVNGKVESDNRSFAWWLHDEREGPLQFCVGLQTFGFPYVLARRGAWSWVRYCSYEEWQSNPQGTLIGEKHLDFAFLMAQVIQPGDRLKFRGSAFNTTPFTAKLVRLAGYDSKLNIHWSGYVSMNGRIGDYVPFYYLEGIEDGPVAKG